ncbi:hypothetical protein TrLO_g2872 [Triparma laevis f. longispina]|uniref:FAD-binding FR-type domain-containing protein n=1 Tax=Triparma laevis f. longispina TaxID=1714387 RepID=A0A9W7F8D9_9STRA|nr:hypothetical protein TrLO_g2872 [Triparma laevis f. longispina]
MMNLVPVPLLAAVAFAVVYGWSSSRPGYTAVRATCTKYSDENYKGLTPFFLLVLPLLLVILLSPCSASFLSPFTSFSLKKIHLTHTSLTIQSFLFLLLNGVFILNAILRHEPSQHSTSTNIMEISNSFAICGLYNMSLFLIPVSSYTKILSSLRISEEHSLAFHRLSGQTSIIFYALHGFLHLLRFLIYQKPESTNSPNFFNWMVLPPSQCYSSSNDSGYDCDDCSCYHFLRNATGFWSALFMVLIAIWSREYIRRKFYRWFYASHILLSPIALILMILHWNKMFIYFVPSFSLYSYSKLISFWEKRCNAEGSEIIENKEVCGGVWVLKLRKEIEEKAGQYIKIELAEDSMIRPSHPYTISSPPSSSTLRILYRHNPLSSFSCSLTSSTKLYIKGYYGANNKLEHVLKLRDSGYELNFVAGGIGITPFLPILLSLSNSTMNKSVTLIWSTRDRGLITYLTPDLLKIQSLGVTLKIHETDGDREGDGLIHSSSSSAPPTTVLNGLKPVAVHPLKTKIYKAPIIAALFLILSYYVALSFWINYQDKHIISSRIYAPVVVVLMALWLGFFLNLKPVKQWLRKSDRFGRLRGSDDSTGDLEMASVQPVGVGAEVGVRKRSSASEEEEGRDVSVSIGRPRLEFKGGREAVFVCGPEEVSEFLHGEAPFTDSNTTAKSSSR